MASFSQSSIDKGSDKCVDYSCTTCEEQNIMKSADFYCEQCRRFYCGQCIYHHGKVFTKHTAYGSGDMNKWPHSTKVKDTPQKCTVHKDEKLDHRHCLNVTLVSGSAKQQSTMAVLGNPDQVFTVKGKSEYNVRIPSDSSACWINGICVLPDGQILVVDYKNKKLKLLDQQYRVLTHCDVSTYPRDICHITHSEVAVTVSDDNTHEIQFISVNNGQLVKGRKLQLQHHCEGIAHHQGELYVTDWTALYKYTLSGKLVSKLYEDTSGGLTVWTCAVSPTGELIYITNRSQHQLLALARDGSVLSTLEDPELQHPEAVHVTPAGQVWVGGWGSHTIIQVDSEGRKKLATLATGRDGVRFPVSVCYNRHTASIIVGQRKNNILVFTVQ